MGGKEGNSYVRMFVDRGGASVWFVRLEERVGICCGEVLKQPLCALRVRFLWVGWWVWVSDVGVQSGFVESAVVGWMDSDVRTEDRDMYIT